MAQFTRANGDFYPVLRLDATGYSNPGVNAVESGATVQPQGPKLDFFNIELADIAANTTLANIAMLTIQQKAVVYIYEFTNDATDGSFNRSISYWRLGRNYFSICYRYSNWWNINSCSISNIH